MARPIVAAVHRARSLRNSRDPSSPWNFLRFLVVFWELFEGALGGFWEVSGVREALGRP